MEIACILFEYFNRNLILQRSLLYIQSPEGQNKKKINKQEKTTESRQERILPIFYIFFFALLWPVIREQKNVAKILYVRKKCRRRALKMGLLLVRFLFDINVHISLSRRIYFLYLPIFFFCFFLSSSSPKSLNFFSFPLFTYVDII